jgi:NitT/TauT family transport system substrate-binding protein
VPFGLNGQNVFSETERLAKLRSGEWDVLLTTLDTYALLADPEVGKIVALVDESAGADKILVRAPIRTINDLRGKRVSYSEGSVSEFFLYSSLALAGLTANDVQRRPAETITEALQLYRAGAVDAVVGWEPDILDLEGLPDTRVLLTTERYRAILDAMIVSTRAIREKPDAVQKWVEAWFAAVKLSIDDPRQAGEAVVRSGNSDWTGIARPEDYPEALKTTAQATLAQNQLAFNDPAALAARFKEAQAVWQSAGRTVRPVDPNALIEPRFVLQAANDPTLLSTRPPVNDTFALTSRIQAPRLSAEEIGRAEPVAVLPLQFIQFDPDSAVIRPESRRDIAEQVVPVLKRTPGVYLKVEGSAAKPLGVSDEEVEQTARDRTAAVVSFIVGQGIDPNRIISGTLKPQFPNSTREEELRQDRKVVFTLIVPQGR